MKHGREGPSGFRAGFTMIELIIVITIIGALSAVLLPKYIDLSALAKAAVSNKIHGDIKSTLHSVYGMHLMQNASGTVMRPPLVTTCAVVLTLLDDSGGLACANDTMLTFPDYRMAVLTPENFSITPPTSAVVADLQ